MGPAVLAVRRWCEADLPTVHSAGVPLDLFCLATFNEADDLHLATAARAYQRIDFVDSLDQYGPRGHRTGTGAVGSRFLGVDRRTVDRRTVDRRLVGFGVVGLTRFFANAALPV